MWLPCLLSVLLQKSTCFQGLAFGDIFSWTPVAIPKTWLRSRCRHFEACAWLPGESTFQVKCPRKQRYPLAEFDGIERFTKTGRLSGNSELQAPKGSLASAEKRSCGGNSLTLNLGSGIFRIIITRSIRMTHTPQMHARDFCCKRRGMKKSV